MYNTWTSAKGSKEAALKNLGKVYSKIRPTRASYQPYSDIYPGVSVRDGYNRRDYEALRTDEAVQGGKGLIDQIYDSYKNVGIVQNIVDLMVDFIVQGIHLVHPIRGNQKFYQAWWKRVDGYERSERIASSTILAARTIVQRATGTITVKEKKRLKKGQAGLDNTIPKIRKGEIPLKYTLHNPNSVKPIGGNLGLFAGVQRYGLVIPPDIVGIVKKPKTEIDKQIVANDIPPEIVAAIKAGNNVIPLDNSQISVLHYRKNDWEQWGSPMLQSVMADLITLKKLKLADLSALDGAISRIRLWTIGDLEHKILPSEAAFQLLNDQLMQNISGGAIDLMWGPELKLQESSTDLHRFLGKEKYVPTLEAIYSGLGIPSTLTGEAGASGGFTNNFVGIQTLLERLRYVRTILTEFWEKELAIVQRAMGHAKPAIVKYSKMTLTDEAAIKTLLLGMYDRNIISLETAQEILGEDADLERIRMQREEKQREDGRLAKKAGPWYNPQHLEDLEKVALQSGQVTPSQVGLELDPKKGSEKLLMDVQKTVPPGTKKKGQPGQGRPKNKKDSTKRKQKRVLPRSKSEQIKVYNWVRSTQQKITDVIDPIWLQLTAKKNLRSLSTEEFEQLETLKFGVLANLDWADDVSDEHIVFLAQQTDLTIPDDVCNLYREATLGLDKLTINERREMQAQAYLLSLEVENVEN